MRGQGVVVLAEFVFPGQMDAERDRMGRRFLEETPGRLNQYGRGVSDPVFGEQVRNSRKFSDIVCDQDNSQKKRMGGDQHIERAQEMPLFPELCS